MTGRIRGAAMGVLVLTAMAVPTGASDPMGVYCIVDKVVLEPGDCPDRAQVWGTCAVANRNDWYFQAPTRGYFYYAIQAGREDQTRAEWSDLKSVAGTGQAVGYGRRYTPAGRLRAAGEKPASPDVYPLHLGVMKVGTGRLAPEVAEVVQQLKTAAGGR